MPTSVLLAVLAAAGLLALAPALVRRYDATERLVAERALSTARVLARAGVQRSRRQRTVPGRYPKNPPRAYLHRLADGVPVSGAGPPGAAGAAAAPGPVPRQRGGPDAPVSALPVSAVPVSGPAETLRSLHARRARQRRRARSRVSTRGVYRRRRVFAALVLLNVVEVVGLLVYGPGFWISSAVTLALLAGYLLHLRRRALVEQRRRREEARFAAWIVARQAAVRREQARRATMRRAMIEQQLAQREEARREAARLAMNASLRGRPYDSRAVNQ